MLPLVVTDRIVHFSDFREKFLLATIFGLNDQLTRLIEEAPPKLLFWFLDSPYSTNNSLHEIVQDEIQFRAAKFWHILHTELKRTSNARKNLQRTLVAIAISDPFPDVKDEFYEFIVSRLRQKKHWFYFSKPNCNFFLLFFFISCNKKNTFLKHTYKI